MLSKGFMEMIKQYIDSLVELTMAMSPYLLLGFLFAGILKVWFPQKWIDRFMGKNNWQSVINTAMLGIPLPLCSCGVIPTGISFYKNGASKGSSVSFLISTPQTGIDSILVSYSLLGLPFAIIRVIVALITGIIGGGITNLIASKDATETKQQSDQTPKENFSRKKSIKQVFQYGFGDFLMDIAKWLIIGILIAAFLDILIPENFFGSYISQDWLSMLMILIASIPLYICATASVPIAAVLMLKGLSPGAALVFLMAGPATNAATITIIKKVFGNKTLLSYLGSIILGAIFFGTLINLLPKEWFDIASDHHHLHHEHELVPIWLQALSSITLISLIAVGYLKRYQKNKKSLRITPLNQTSTDNPSNDSSIINKSNTPAFNLSDFKAVQPLITKTFKVEGMTCSHCKKSVETNLIKLPGISKVLADPQNNKVQFEGSQMNIDQIKKEIESLGYKFMGE
ncbi:permease [Carboxylicivirga sp. M1479]|uniref:permease n=1 Tax=Carboxylicivirga sp. M1479 TaxID=2594476 RepID=UPI001177DBB6|nr:permease [Carboxylicivirga sp. M1479]TRX70986.1 heavy metal-associated domain-containing protein [Carboxylicivirga sp. M1479]